MNKDDALAFLALHQPLPSDAELSEDVIKRYDEVRRFFLEHPDPDCVRPLLNSFGNGNGHGVYQLIENVIRKLPTRIVVAELIQSMRSEHRGVRYWSVQIAALFPVNTLLPELRERLREDDFDMKYAALTALEQIGAEAKPVIAEFLVTESDPELRSLAEGMLPRP